MKLTFILLLSTITFLGGAYGQDANAGRLQSFLQKVSESNVPAEKIISDYICTLPSQMADSLRRQINSLITERIMLLRNQLQAAHSNELVIKKYRELPSAEQHLLLSEDTKDDVYIVKLNNKYLISVLFKANRITSFHTLNKGGKSVFLLFCP